MMGREMADYREQPLYVEGVAAHDRADYAELDRIARRIIAESEAAGDKAALESYLTRLKSGPFFSRVDAVDEEWREPSATYSGFVILY